MASAAGSSSSSSSNKRPWDEKQQHPLALPKHGNFRGYYSIRHEVDSRSGSRLESIQSWLDKNTQRNQLCRVLDIGCNTGVFTLQLCEILQGRSETVIGVDIDRELVLLAGSSARRSSKFALSSRDEAPRALGSGRIGKSSNAGPRKRLRLEDSSQLEPLVARFLQSNWVYNDQMYQSRSEKCPEEMTRMQWNNISEVAKEDCKGYNLIFAMSITKWIHINNYDTGLRRFFARVVSCLAPNGIFILEPQSYKSYKQTQKVTPPDSQPRRNFYAIRVMPDDFAWILTVELGLHGPFRIREKGKDGELKYISVDRICES